MASTYIFNSVVRPTQDGSNFISPTIIYGVDGKTPLFTTSNPANFSKVGVMTQLDFTDTPLSASAIYNSSSSFDISMFSDIIGSVMADQAGTLNVMQSWDNTNWDVLSTFNITAGNGQGFDVSVVAPYCRIVYTNSSTAQGTFRLYVGGRS